VQYIRNTKERQEVFELAVDKDWSCDLEAEVYVQDKELLIKDAIKAIEETGDEHFVNLVTPAELGHPDGYLVPILKRTFGDNLSAKFVDQCGCGGFVLKVSKAK